MLTADPEKRANLDVILKSKYITNDGTSVLDLNKIEIENTVKNS